MLSMEVVGASSSTGCRLNLGGEGGERDNSRVAGSSAGTHGGGGERRKEECGIVAGRGQVTSGYWIRGTSSRLGAM